MLVLLVNNKVDDYELPEGLHHEETPSGLQVAKGAVDEILQLIAKYVNRNPLTIWLDQASYIDVLQSSLIENDLVVVHEDKERLVYRVKIRGKQVDLVIDKKKEHRQVFTLK